VVVRWYPSNALTPTDRRAQKHWRRGTRTVRRVVTGSLRVRADCLLLRRVGVDFWPGIVIFGWSGVNVGGGRQILAL
jgi:hypothetical protein